MSQPEIARRCPSCGVSLRERAFFCPQCGEQLPPAPAAPTESPVKDARAVQKVKDVGAAQKWRQISRNVFGEAAGDPSLRFVLVAAVIFIFFIAILILSEVIN